MLGTVNSADMDLIGQLRPHAAIRFVPATTDDALAARRERQATLAAIRRAVSETSRL